MQPYQEIVNDLEQILDQKGKDYPVRTDSTVALDLQLDKLAGYFMANLPQAADLNNDATIAISRLAERPVFVCGQMKSGTTLIPRLLDGHPQLFVLPGDSHYRRYRSRLPPDNLGPMVRFWLERMINPTGNHPFWFVGPEKKTFDTIWGNLQTILKEDRYDPFISLMLSTYLTLGGNDPSNLNKRYWVEKTPLNEKHVQTLSAAHPQAKFIHIIRDPLTNLASLKRLTALRERNATMWQHARATKQLMQLASANQNRLGPNRYHLLRYEDLTQAPQATLTGICQFLEIPFHENLLQPTENGRPTSPNSMFGVDKPAGRIISQPDRSRSLNALTEAEIQDIVTFTYEEAIRFGYKWESDYKRYIRPAPMQWGRNLMQLTGLLKNRLFN